MSGIPKAMTTSSGTDEGERMSVPQLPLSAGLELKYGHPGPRGSVLSPYRINHPWRAQIDSEWFGGEEETLP